MQVSLAVTNMKFPKLSVSWITLVQTCTTPAILPLLILPPSISVSSDQPHRFLRLRLIVVVYATIHYHFSHPSIFLSLIFSLPFFILPYLDLRRPTKFILLITVYLSHKLHNRSPFQFILPRPSMFCFAACHHGPLKSINLPLLNHQFWTICFISSSGWK